MIDQDDAHSHLIIVCMNIKLEPSITKHTNVNKTVVEGFPPEMLY